MIGLWLWIVLMVSIMTWTRKLERRVEGRDRDLVVGFGGFLVAVLLASLVSTFFEIAPMDVYFWMLLGVVATLAPRTRRGPAVGGPSDVRAGSGPGAAARSAGVS